MHPASSDRHSPRVMLRWSGCRDAAATAATDVAATLQFAADAHAGIVYRPAADPDGVAAALVPRGAGVDLDTRGASGDQVARALSLLPQGAVHHVVTGVHGTSRRVVAAELEPALRLVDDDRARGLSVSPSTSAALDAASRVCPVASVVVPLSLLDRRAEAELVPRARELEADLVLIAPLAGGTLARTGRAGPTDRPRLRQLDAAAARRNVGSTRLALAWLLARFPGAYVAPSTRRVEHFEMDLAAERIELDERDVAELDRIFA